jgi:V/A-type H+-transporting ATPase subunit F
MFGFVIGSNAMVTGFKLVGLEGKEVTSANSAKDALTQALTRKDLALIVISEEFSSQIQPDIEKARTEHTAPLIVELPESTGATEKTRMSTVIGKTLGMQL